jgi:hypothetical protein
MGFFSAESLIIDRLSAKAGEAKDVFSLESYQTALTGGGVKRLPALLVVFSGHSVADQIVGGEKIEQVWTVVAIGKAVRQSKDNATQSRDAIGLMIEQAITALIGWVPSKDYSAIKMVQPLHSPEFADGTVYVPFAFSTSTVIKDDINA